MKIPKVSLAVLGAALIIGGYALWNIHQRVSPLQIDHGPVNQAPDIKPAIPPISGDAKPAASSKKGTLLLPVPFTAQAPTANWDQLHNEACEEADALMAAAYFKGDRRTNLPADFVESEIGKLTDWEQKNFGYNLDTTSAETAKMIDQVYGLHTELLNGFTDQQLRQELDQGRLVIISENGRLLGNPNYKQPGPLHHMLLLKGYTPNGFVTNDSGTRRGLNYPYDFSTLHDATGDWVHSQNSVDTNKKIAIIVWK